VETTEAVPEGIVIGGDAFGRHWFSCSMCGLVSAGKSWSEVSTRYNAERHAMTKRHIKRTAPKTQPVTAQEAQEPQRFDVSWQGLTSLQVAGLLLLMTKWLTEEKQ